MATLKAVCNLVGQEVKGNIILEQTVSILLPTFTHYLGTKYRFLAQAAVEPRFSNYKYMLIGHIYIE